MQPWECIDRTRAPDGTELLLARRGAEWTVRAGGRVLMSSRTHGSEEALATLALKRLEARRTILVGGLGLGFTLRAVLDQVPTAARVIVAELVPGLVAWNRGPVAHLARWPLDDARVRLQIGDVAARIAEATSAFDAILLDVDNSPSSLVLVANDQLYGDAGVRACHGALRPGGVLAVWSAGPDRRYRERLDRAGFAAEEHAVRARGGSSGVRHVVFLGVKSAARRPLAGGRRPRR